MIHKSTPRLLICSSSTAHRCGMLPTDFRWPLTMTCQDSMEARACWAESLTVGALATSLSCRAELHSWSSQTPLFNREGTTTLMELTMIFPMSQLITRGQAGQHICRECLVRVS